MPHPSRRRRRQTYPTSVKNLLWNGGNLALPRRRTARLPIRQKTGMSRRMEELFGDPGYKGFVLQDKKRLPARFFARISGALTSRLS
jgi:hypothetical protein